MIIDTDKVSNWAATHLTLVIPAGTGTLAWFAALRWNAAFALSETPLSIFYFCVCAVSGVTTALLILSYLNKIGVFNGLDGRCRCR